MAFREAKMSAAAICEQSATITVLNSCTQFRVQLFTSGSTRARLSSPTEVEVEVEVGSCCTRARLSSPTEVEVGSCLVSLCARSLLSSERRPAAGNSRRARHTHANYRLAGLLRHRRRTPRGGTASGRRNRSQSSLRPPIPFRPPSRIAVCPVHMEHRLRVWQSAHKHHSLRDRGKWAAAALEHTTYVLYSDYQILCCQLPFALYCVELADGFHFHSQTDRHTHLRAECSLSLCANRIKCAQWIGAQVGAADAMAR